VRTFGKIYSISLPIGHMDMEYYKFNQRLFKSHWNKDLQQMDLYMILVFIRYMYYTRHS